MAKYVDVVIDGVLYRGGYWITPTGRVQFDGFPVEEE